MKKQLRISLLTTAIVIGLGVSGVANAFQDLYSASPATYNKVDAIKLLKTQNKLMIKGTQAQVAKATSDLTRAVPNLSSVGYIDKNGNAQALLTTKNLNLKNSKLLTNHQMLKACVGCSTDSVIGFLPPNSGYTIDGSSGIGFLNVKDAKDWSAMESKIINDGP